jgi:hypothetical protein
LYVWKFLLAKGSKIKLCFIQQRQNVVLSYCPLLIFQLCPKKTSFACFPRFSESLLCYKNFVFISKGKYKPAFASKASFRLALLVNKALLYLLATGLVNKKTLFFID